MTTDVSEQRRQADVRFAVRALLRRPLLRRDADATTYDVVRRVLEPVDRWFADTTGWTLEHDRPAGIVRLRKVAGRIDATRPPNGGFTRRHYVLLCLLLSELDHAGQQVTLRRLAEHLRQATLAEPRIAAFDATLHDERRTFVHVVRWLIDGAGVLRRRDGDEEVFLRSTAAGDALYDVDDRALSLLLAPPRSPSAGGSPEGLSLSFYADTDEGRRRRLSQHVFRRLLDDPIVYLDDLEPDAREWLTYSLRRVHERLAEVGLHLERRYEGVAVIDPDGEVSDEQFPRVNSTESHAALLLAEWLTVARTARIPDVQHRIAEWQESAKGARWKHETPGEITAGALTLLAKFQLVRLDGDRVTALPAIARFRAVETAGDDT